MDKKSKHHRKDDPPAKAKTSSGEARAQADSPTRRALRSNAVSTSGADNNGGAPMPNALGSVVGATGGGAAIPTRPVRSISARASRWVGVDASGGGGIGSTLSLAITVAVRNAPAVSDSADDTRGRARVRPTAANHNVRDITAARSNSVRSRGRDVARTVEGGGGNDGDSSTSVPIHAILVQERNHNGQFTSRMIVQNLGSLGGTRDAAVAATPGSNARSRKDATVSAAVPLPGHTYRPRSTSAKTTTRMEGNKGSNGIGATGSSGRDGPARRDLLTDSYSGATDAQPAFEQLRDPNSRFGHVVRCNPDGIRTSSSNGLVSAMTTSIAKNGAVSASVLPPPLPTRSRSTVVKVTTANRSVGLAPGGPGDAAAGGTPSDAQHTVEQQRHNGQLERKVRREADVSNTRSSHAAVTAPVASAASIAAASARSHTASSADNEPGHSGSDPAQSRKSVRKWKLNPKYDFEACKSIFGQDAQARFAVDTAAPDRANPAASCRAVLGSPDASRRGQSPSQSDIRELRENEHDSRSASTNATEAAVFSPISSNLHQSGRAVSPPGVKARIVEAGSSRATTLELVVPVGTGGALIGWNSGGTKRRSERIVDSGEEVVAPKQQRRQVNVRADSPRTVVSHLAPPERNPLYQAIYNSLNDVERQEFTMQMLFKMSFDELQNQELRQQMADNWLEDFRNLSHVEAKGIEQEWAARKFDISTWPNNMLEPQQHSEYNKKIVDAANEYHGKIDAQFRDFRKIIGIVDEAPRTIGNGPFWPIPFTTNQIELFDGSHPPHDDDYDYFADNSNNEQPGCSGIRDIGRYESSEERTQLELVQQFGEGNDLRQQQQAFREFEKEKADAPQKEKINARLRIRAETNADIAAKMQLENSETSSSSAASPSLSSGGSDGHSSTGNSGADDEDTDNSLPMMAHKGDSRSRFSRPHIFNATSASLAERGRVEVKVTNKKQMDRNASSSHGSLAANLEETSSSPSSSSSLLICNGISYAQRLEKFQELKSRNSSRTVPVEGRSMQTKPTSPTKNSNVDAKVASDDDLELEGTRRKHRTQKDATQSKRSGARNKDKAEMITNRMLLRNSATSISADPPSPHADLSALRHSMTADDVSQDVSQPMKVVVSATTPSSSSTPADEETSVSTRAKRRRVEIDVANKDQMDTSDLEERTIGTRIAPARNPSTLGSLSGGLEHPSTSSAASSSPALAMRRSTRANCTKMEPVPTGCCSSSNGTHDDSHDCSSISSSSTPSSSAIGKPPQTRAQRSKGANQSGEPWPSSHSSMEQRPSTSSSSSGHRTREKTDDEKWREDNHVKDGLKKAIGNKKKFMHTCVKLDEHDKEAIKHRLETSLNFIQPSRRNWSNKRADLLKQEKKKKGKTNLNLHRLDGFPFPTPPEPFYRFLGKRPDACGPMECYDCTSDSSVKMPDYEFIDKNEDDEEDKDLHKKRDKTKMCEYECDCDPEIGCVWPTCKCMKESAYRNGLVHTIRGSPVIAVECCEKCSCKRLGPKGKDLCPSVVQIRDDIKLEAFNLGKPMGFGIRTGVSIQRGEVIMEFTGQRTTKDKGETKNWAYTTVNGGDDPYWQNFTGVFDKTHNHHINPLKKGNASRLLSHSFYNNVGWMCIYKGGIRVADARAIIFAYEPLEPGDIAYLDYGSDFGISNCPDKIKKSQEQARKDPLVWELHPCVCKQDLCHDPVRSWFRQLTWSQAFWVLRTREEKKRARMIMLEREARGCPDNCEGDCKRR